MKKISFILVILLMLILLLVALGDVRLLKQQNNSLLASIDKINYRIADLESDKTMQNLMALRQENSFLKAEIDNLRVALVQQPREELQLEPDLSLIQKETPKIELKKTPVTEKSSGNRGYLFKK